MARKRMISPEMFTSATVSGWPAHTRWTWMGLLCYLDDYGYGEESADLIKAAVWPRDGSYTPRKVQADVDRIVADGSLCRFTCCGKPIVHAPTWTDWQKVSHPTGSRLCPCPAHAPDASRISHEGFGSDSGAAPRSVVKENRNEGSSSDQPSDLPDGSDGQAAARDVISGLKQRRAGETLRAARTA